LPQLWTLAAESASREEHAAALTLQQAVLSRLAASVQVVPPSPPSLAPDPSQVLPPLSEVSSAGGGVEGAQGVLGAMPGASLAAALSEQATVPPASGSSPLCRGLPPPVASAACDRPSLVGRERHYVPPAGPATEHARAAAARFLGHVFSRLRGSFPLWRPGQRMPAVYRPVPHCRCRYGLDLAPRAEFEAQSQLAAQLLDWEREHIELLRRLESGRAPLMLDLFCGAGGVSEGFRRMGASSYTSLVIGGLGRSQRQLASHACALSCLVCASVCRAHQGLVCVRLARPSFSAPSYRCDV